MDFSHEKVVLFLCLGRLSYSQFYLYMLLMITLRAIIYMFLVIVVGIDLDGVTETKIVGQNNQIILAVLSCLSSLFFANAALLFWFYMRKSVRAIMKFSVVLGYFSSIFDLGISVTFLVFCISVTHKSMDDFRKFIGLTVKSYERLEHNQAIFYTIAVIAICVSIYEFYLMSLYYELIYPLQIQLTKQTSIKPKLSIKETLQLKFRPSRIVAGEDNMTPVPKQSTIPMPEEYQKVKKPKLSIDENKNDSRPITPFNISSQQSILPRYDSKTNIDTQQDSDKNLLQSIHNFSGFYGLRKSGIQSNIRRSRQQI